MPLLFHLVSIAEPSGYPRNISIATVTSKSALITWIPPADEEKNGIITSYTVSLLEAEREEEIYLQTKMVSINVTGLMPFTTYFVSIAASTSVGIGPFGTMLVMNTQEDG